MCCWPLCLGEYNPDPECLWFNKPTEGADVTIPQERTDNALAEVEKEAMESETLAGASQLALKTFRALQALRDEIRGVIPQKAGTRD